MIVFHRRVKRENLFIEKIQIILQLPLPGLLQIVLKIHTDNTVSLSFVMHKASEPMFIPKSYSSVGSQ